MIKSDSISNLVKALIAAQDKFDPVLKEKDNPFFHSKYADLAAVVAATQPTLIEHGLVISQFPVSEEGRVGVLTILAHTSGEFIAESCALPIAKQDAQTGVAAVTYTRRTAYLGVIGIAAEDDDGNTAAGRNESTQEQPARKRGRPAAVPQPIEDAAVSAAAKSLPLAEPNVPVEVTGFKVPATDAVLPDEKKLQDCRMFIQNLKPELEQAGLKPSPNVPVPRKILLYLLDVAGTDTANKITVTQWDAIIGFINKIRLTEGGIAKLAKLVDASAKKHAPASPENGKGE